MRRRNPAHCLLPPHILQRVARYGDEAQREWALRAMSLDNSIRQARSQNQRVRGRGPREGADVLAVTSNREPRREIRDAQSGEDVHGSVVRREGDPPTGDRAVDEAYEGLGDTFIFFREAYRRHSIDDEGMPLRGVVHFSKDYANAVWDGRRVIFGDGDGHITGLMTSSLDVIGHELGHGVTEDEAALEYFGQAGALNESVSDVFGSLVEQYKKGQPSDEADWLIGAEVWTPNISGDALRSLKAPGEAYDDPLIGKDPQPAHMRDYVDTLQDNGGVHINSGIPNHAFYLVATAIGGYAWEAAGRVWYEALRNPSLRPTTDFARFAQATVFVAQSRYGPGSGEVSAVTNAWEEVGVPVGEA